MSPPRTWLHRTPGSKDRETEQKAATLADEGAAAAKQAGLHATGAAVVCRGQVWATIIKAADERDAEAIVVGSRGRSAVASALLGSVANGVVHHSSRPVVVIPAPK
ncbi:MAG: universal stress protein [Actinomycetota bacterium]|nr:universal stress protein [Actinomycetota bacterium]